MRVLVSYGSSSVDAPRRVSSAGDLPKTASVESGDGLLVSQVELVAAWLKSVATQSVRSKECAYEVAVNQPPVYMDSEALRRSTTGGSLRGVHPFVHAMQPVS